MPTVKTTQVASPESGERAPSPTTSNRETLPSTSMPTTMHELLARSEQAMRNTDGIYHATVHQVVQVDERSGVVWEGDIWIDPDLGTARIEIHDPASITGDESANGWFTAALMIHRDQQNYWLIRYTDGREEHLTVPHRCIDVGQPMVSILSCVTTRGYLANIPDAVIQNPDWVMSTDFSVTESDFQGVPAILAESPAAWEATTQSLFAFDSSSYLLLGFQDVDDSQDKAVMYVTTYEPDVVVRAAIDPMCFDESFMSISQSCKSS